MVKMTPKERKKVLPMFSALDKECQVAGTCSILESAQRLNLDHNEILELAKQDEAFSIALAWCKQGCFLNDQRDWLEGKLEEEIAMRASIENLNEDDEERDYFVKELHKIQRDKGKRVNFMIEETKNLNHVSQDALGSQLQNEKPKTFCDDQLMQEYVKERDAAEQNRIKDWRLKGAKKEARVVFEKMANPENEIKSVIPRVKRGKNLSLEQKHEIIYSEAAAATGSHSIEFFSMLFSQTINTLPKNDIDAINSMYNTLVSMQPNDEFEAMLMARMIALHNQYMHYMHSSINAEHQDLRDRHINNATKLMRLYNESIDSLSKYRRKGEQKVTVQHNHVNVNDGGKAIVGSDIGGGDYGKK